MDRVVRWEERLAAETASLRRREEAHKVKGAPRRSPHTALWFALVGAVTVGWFGSVAVVVVAVSSVPARGRRLHHDQG